MKVYVGKIYNRRVQLDWNCIQSMLLAGPELTEFDHQSLAKEKI